MNNKIKGMDFSVYVFLLTGTVIKYLSPTRINGRTSSTPYLEQRLKKTNHQKSLEPYANIKHLSGTFEGRENKKTAPINKKLQSIKNSYLQQSSRSNSSVVWFRSIKNIINLVSSLFHFRSETNSA